MNAEQQLNQWGQIVAKAWQDDDFKKPLVENPLAVLKEYGMRVPDGVQIRVVENTEHLVYLTLPAKQRDGELSDAELEGVAGGFDAIKAFNAVAQAVNRFATAVGDKLIDVKKDAIKADASGGGYPGQHTDHGFGDGRE